MKKIWFLLLRGLNLQLRSNKFSIFLYNIFSMATHPEWVLRHKIPNTEIRCIRGKYYLYNITSVWCPEKNRTKKKNTKTGWCNNRRIRTNPNWHV